MFWNLLKCRESKEDAPPFLLVSTGQAIIALSTIFGSLSNPVAGEVTGEWQKPNTFLPPQFFSLSFLTLIAERGKHDPEFMREVQRGLGPRKWNREHGNGSKVGEGSEGLDGKCLCECHPSHQF